METNLVDVMEYKYNVQWLEYFSILDRKKPTDLIFLQYCSLNEFGCDFKLRIDEVLIIFSLFLEKDEKIFLNVNTNEFLFKLNEITQETINSIKYLINLCGLSVADIIINEHDIILLYKER